MHHARFSVCRTMFPARLLNQRKAMMYSFFVLIVCIVFYFVICLGSYSVDSEKLLPGGAVIKELRTFLNKTESSSANERPKVQIIPKTMVDNQHPVKKHQGRVNMHVFEDCCGGSLHKLRSNMLYPLFPNVRTTVSRLSISPQWKNYGLRTFGYIHPSVTGEYIFAVGSDDNSEFWLSLNESPQNLERLAYVGEVGDEWSAPGEYWKFASQISKPVLLVKDMKYFFEALLKQGEGLDHLQVAWRLNQDSSSFEVITSEFLSLYEDESSLLMGDIDHIPQTEASYDRFLESIPTSPNPVGDMIREDLRDHIFKIPLIDKSYMKDLFPECDYKPSYIIGTRIGRYQGVNLIHFSSVYPNDYTRQTYAHDEHLCFYKQDTSFDESKGFAGYLNEVVDPDVQRNNEEDHKRRYYGECWQQKTIGLHWLAYFFCPYNRSQRRPTVLESFFKYFILCCEEGPNWQRVYDVAPFDAGSKQSSLAVNSCKRAGNIVMSQNQAMPIVKAFMTALHSKDTTRGYSLLRVLNVVRRQDNGKGSRYLVELELVGSQGQKVLVSSYVYAKQTETPQQLPALCSPKQFNWNPSATVHVVVAVKNQARWVIQFIREMEKIYRVTGDKNFNVIIIDYNSSDMDIEKRLKNGKLPSYTFKKMEGNFQRSGGLQAGINLVEDAHSILFLTDLHLYHPLNLLNSIRKHSVEGKMVYAPVVMRLDCGASPRAPSGFWETAGYGLMAIYKSDIDRIGGMNTAEFKDKWGGEDWELLDRVLEHGLEVERLHVRNFLHHFHSKRGMWGNSA